MSAPKAHAWVLLTALDPTKYKYKSNESLYRIFDALHGVLSSAMHGSNAALPH